MADAFNLPYGDFRGRLAFINAANDPDGMPDVEDVDEQSYRYTGLGV